MNDEDPSLQQRSRGKTGVVILLVLLILVVIGAVFYGTYLWQQSRVADLQQQITGLNQQLTNAQKQNSTTQNGGTTTTASTNTSYTSNKGVKVNVYLPAQGAKLKSPVAVVGEVPGNWSFEASFPVILKDSTGSIIAKTPAQLLGDWMTTDLVPFSVKLVYSSATSGDGTLVLQKDNPSGLATNDDSVTIPIKFE